MSISLGPDWRALAAAQKLELSDQSITRLEELGKTMLGLRGMIDWTEEPSQMFEVREVAEGDAE
ncbi:hypothetical protein [uncultured Paludibaculum sp.]|uniref:hypothetical protein n=1 Tax=uncultured Paludibaculum sp. TaxID=1765020 RepID=UPI002AABB2E1|nr:hypothetical protein [uncultured Paludibaculum sp.]